MSVDVIQMDALRARALTDRIKVGVEAVWTLVAEAYESGAWSVLGYSSWDDYCTREFGNARLRLPREDRREVVASLRESGLSIRAIAAATGADTKTVQNDLKQVSEIPTPASAPEPDDEPDPTPAGPGSPAAKPVKGIDGKTYPQPAAPRRILTPEQIAEREDAERIGRSAKRLGMFVIGWIEYRHLAINPDRERIVACLTDREQELLADAERSISWAA